MITNDSGNRVKTEMSIQEAIEVLTNNNLGSREVLFEAAAMALHFNPKYIDEKHELETFRPQTKDFASFSMLRNVDSYGIYDAKAWQLYSDVCNKNIHAFISLLHACDINLISQEQLHEAIKQGPMHKLDLKEIATAVSNDFIRIEKEQNTSHPNPINEDENRIPYNMFLEDSDIVIRLLTSHDVSILALKGALGTLEKIDPDYAADHYNLKYFVISMDALGLHDNKPWILLHKICGDDIEKFALLIRAFDLEILSQKEIQRAICDVPHHSLDVAGIIDKVKANIRERSEAASNSTTPIPSVKDQAHNLFNRIEGAKAPTHSDNARQNVIPFRRHPKPTPGKN